MINDIVCDDWSSADEQLRVCDATRSKKCPFSESWQKKNKLTDKVVVWHRLIRSNVLTSKANKQEKNLFDLYDLVPTPVNISKRSTTFSPGTPSQRKSFVSV